MHLVSFLQKPLTINIYGSNELLPTFYVDIYVDIDKYITYKIHLAR
jgi:hypothetical protein